MNQFCGGGIFGISTGESHGLEHASHHAILQAYLHVIRSATYTVICFWSRRIHIHSCKRPRHPMKYMRGDSILCCVESHQLMIPRQFLLPDAITCQKFRCKQWLPRKEKSNVSSTSKITRCKSYMVFLGKRYASQRRNRTGYV